MSGRPVKAWIRCMQGKSCFNFTTIDEGLFDELSAITTTGREQYAARGWLAV
jgi:hypothetical protein